MLILYFYMHEMQNEMKSLIVATCENNLKLVRMGTISQ